MTLTLIALAALTFSKARLLTQINEFLMPNLDGTEQSFTDLFSGSGVVSQYFKDRFKITSNDLMYFSYVIARATVQLNHVPTYAKLAQAGIADPFKYLQSKDLMKRRVRSAPCSPPYC